ncbi:target of Sbf [Vermiconidia calcicola]|uniref:Target of Sbf n=1 Tax=Vermiconidia calcicola TaxID=1690605 RepID=A0ACC3NGZ3_9PEZI|nr:target of Sbf [Vermiconidia calcicola]
MKRILPTVALMAAATSAQDGCANDRGNWYCARVNAITYTGVGGEGTYKRVTNMDPYSGTCSSELSGYSGTLSPLNEEVSLHVRGPTILKQFAAYAPGLPSTRKVKRTEHARRHAHGAKHVHHGHPHEKRAVGDMVTATINGLVQTWINTYDGLPSEPTAVEVPPIGNGRLVSPAADGGYEPAPSEENPPAPSADYAPEIAYSGAPSSSEGSVWDVASTGDGWGRSAYFDASSAVAEGMVFLNHFGGQGSGTFDYSFGNSLSYASCDAQAGASSPQVLEDCELPSGREVVLMTNETCEEDSCGYTRPGTVAHHGFAGSRKAFFFEFQMPETGETSENEYDPVNMPAIWMLNAQIPRTLQYGNADCSCWTSGCGEFDIFEVLASGDSRAKSTLHGNRAGGDSNYFDRPVDAPIKVGVVMYDDNIHIKILDSSMEFPSVMDEATINDILGSTLTQNSMVSLFRVADVSG